VAAWLSGNSIAHINQVTPLRAQLDWDGSPRLSSVPGAGHLSRYVTSHAGQLSLAIPSWEGVVNTN